MSHRPRALVLQGGEPSSSFYFCPTIEHALAWLSSDRQRQRLLDGLEQRKSELGERNLVMMGFLSLFHVFCVVCLFHFPFTLHHHRTNHTLIDGWCVIQEFVSGCLANTSIDRRVHL